VTKKKRALRLSSPEIREMWGNVFFGNSKKRKEKENRERIESPKQERLKKYIEIHENSTLNIEKGLENIRKLRKFLQNPAEKEEEIQLLCVPFALEAIEEIESLYIDEAQLQSDFTARFALEYYIGLFALYCAQVKWYYPNLIADEHLEIRDHYMHGTLHSYFEHLSMTGVEQMVSDINFIVNEMKPILLLILQQQSKPNN